MKNAIPEQVLTQHVAFLGKTGSGKTSTAKLAVEQILREDAAARVCVLDTVKSDWWGLTSSSDGRRPGLPFHILGGPRGHVPLHESAGKAIGELVATGALPLSIIDMADFAPGGVQKFFNDFAPALLRKMRGVVHLVIEEAHEVAPKERAGFAAENMAIHWAKKLATAGRSKGLRIMVLTQRTQALHNAVLGSCDTIIAHRLTAPADQGPVKQWLKANVAKDVFEQVSGSLASLKTGTGWICSGEAQVAELVQFPKITTFDNSATPTGAAAAREIKTAPVDAERLRAIIGDAVKDAEANDPAKLRAQIATLTAAKVGLERQVQAGAAKVAADPGAIAAAEQRGYDRGFQRGLAETSSSFDAFESHLGAIGVLLERVTADTKSQHAIVKLNMKDSGSPTVSANAVDTPKRATASASPAARTPSPAASGDGPLPNLGAEKRPLAALAAVYPAGMTEAQWAVAAGLKRSGGTWATYLSRLRTAACIEKRGNEYFATAVGIAAAGESVAPMPPPGPDLVAFWKSKISGVGPMLDALAKRYPRWTSRADLAESIGLTVTGGTFATYVSRLKSPGLIETNGDQVRCMPSLMGY